MRISLFLFLCIVTLNVRGQRVLKGFVTNASNTPLSGVSIRINGTNINTITDSAGRFSIVSQFSENTIITITSYGYTTTERAVTPSHLQKGVRVVLYPNWHELEEVIVTHSRYQHNIQHESMNLETVSSSYIRQNLGGSLMKSLERLPGVKNIGIGSGQSKPLIRGLGFNRVIVIDKGVKHEGQQWGADHGLEIDQFAAGEIDILKGGASFIYGSDAIGGAINIKAPPLPPTNSLGGSIELTGKTNNQSYGTSVNLNVRSHKLFIDARYTYQNYADYKVPTDTVFVYDYAVPLYKHTLRNTAGNETSLHLNTGYVTENFRSVFYISNVQNKSGFFANAHGLEPRRVDMSLHDASRRDIQMPWQKVNHFKIINHTHFDFKNHHWQMETGYQKNHRKEFSQYVNHGFMPAIYPSNTAVPKELERNFDKDVYALNLRDRFLIGLHDFTFGVNAERQVNEIGGWSFLVPAFSQNSAGAFVYDKIRLSNTTILHGALRYDHYSISIKEYKDWFPSVVSDNNNSKQEYLRRAGNLQRLFHSVVWSVGINYNIRNYFIKANIGKSFRVPIAKELAANGVNYHYFSYEKGNPTLNPEQSYQIDIGIGHISDVWSVQMNPFANYFTNYIYLNPTPDYDTQYGAGNQVFEYRQAKVLRFGGELQARYRFHKNIFAELLGEYLYAEQLSGDKKSYTLPFSVPPSMLLSLTYEPLWNGILRNTYFAADYRITAAQNRIVPPEKITPGYRIVNLQAGTKVKLINGYADIHLQIQNLLNTKYFNHTSFYRLIHLPEAGRNITINIKIPISFTHKKNNQ